MIDNCEFCSNHVEKKNSIYNVKCSVNVLVPEEELEFWQSFLRSRNVNVIGGSKNDVLARYLNLSHADFTVRLTSDCPNVPAMTINKAIFTAIHHDLDYLSNAWEHLRTSIDGHDCEVISKKAMEWLSVNSVSDYDREHVTPAIRVIKNDLKLGIMLNKEDISHIKLCIDTPDEYESAKGRFEKSYDKRLKAIKRGIYVYEY